MLRGRDFHNFLIYRIIRDNVYFRVFGIVYALVAILGFFTGNGLLLGLISNNMADTWLHVLIAIVALALGFGGQDTST